MDWRLSVRTGSLVQHCFSEKIGVVIKEVWHPLCGVTSSNKVFDILWRDGTVGHNIWNYDLNILKSS